MTGDRTPTPYWEDDRVQLYLGDMREILPALGITADLVVADPPYAETSLAWDRWPDGWPAVVAGVSRSMWCFGSMRMFLDRRDEFAGWKLSQDVIGVDEDGAPMFGDVTVVWEKHNGSGFTADRFKRVHEYVTHWYRGPWTALHHQVPRVAAQFDPKGRTTSARQDDRAAHTGAIKARPYIDDGRRLIRSVIRVKEVRGGISRTQKPVDLLRPLIEYACPPGGLVIDPFAGSGSTLEAARLTGRRAIGIEAHEPYIEAAAKRLTQAPLEIA